MNEKNVKRKTVTPQEAAEIYTLNVRTLANERAKKCGCPYYLRGRRVFYLVTELEAWLLEHRVLTIDSIKQTK
ncbi:MAG TPA: hypothetical protein PK178_01635 [Smithellaceae bacterium]|nr:hypothetical protein [Smithellaceae bacterium]